jgi:hypothetical protein
MSATQVDTYCASCGGYAGRQDVDAGTVVYCANCAHAAQCQAARTGAGYWTCDTPGGCPDCRALAAELGDADTFPHAGHDVVPTDGVATLADHWCLTCDAPA